MIPKAALTANTRVHAALLNRGRAFCNAVLTGRNPAVSLAFLVVLFVALTGVFVLPWHVKTPFSLSDSYEAGFNNLAAQVFFPVAVLALAVCISRFARGLLVEKTMRVLRLSGDSLSRGDRIAIGVALFLQYSFIFFLWWLPMAYYADGGYFVNRAEAWFQGSRPYWDVEYSHGIIFLAPVVAAARVFRCGVQDIRTIYYIYLAIWATFSILALHWVLRRIALSHAERLIVFCALAIFFVAETGGINAYPLRHLWPFLCLFILGGRAAVLRRSTGVSGETGLIGLAVLLMVSSLFIGPEIFLVCAVTVPAFFFLRFLFAGGMASIAGAGCTAFAGCACLVLSRAFFAGTTSQASGDLNIPVYPSPLVVFYLVGFSMVIAGVLLAFGAGRLSRSQGVLYGRNFAICLAMALMSFGALSRADTAHLIQYGLPVLVVGPAFMRGMPRKAALLILVALVLTAKALMVGFMYAPPLIRATLASPHISDERFASLESFAAGSRKVPGKVRDWIVRVGAMRRPAGGLEDLIPMGFDEKIFAPAALSDAVEKALRERRIYRPPYIDSSVDVAFHKPDYYQRLVQETADSRWLLVPETLLWPLTRTASEEAEKSRAARLSLLAICMFPPASKRNAIPSYLENYRSYVLKQFSIASHADGMVLLRNSGN